MTTQEQDGLGPSKGAAKALSAEDVVRLQAEYHPLVVDGDFASAEELCLHLMHLKAYDVAAELAGGRDVLDLGCNNGYGSCRLAEGARSVVGVDVSEKAIEAARERQAPAHVRFELVDGARLPFDDASFDLVTSLQVIEHVAEVEGYLSEIRRVLRPGGTYLLTTPNAAVRLDPGMTPWNRFHVREYRAGELAERLSRSFEAVEIRGLFASEPWHGTELARVRAARDGARLAADTSLATGAKRAVKSLVRALLPASLLDRLRGGPRDHEQEKAALPEPSLEDFRYEREGLDEALDLLATCRRPAEG